MDRTGAVEVLEVLLERAGAASVPPPGAGIAIAPEGLLLMGAFAGVKAAQALAAADLADWEARIDAVTRRMTEQHQGTAEKNEKEDAEARLISRAAVDARSYLRLMLHRVVSEREQRRHQHREALTALPHALGAVAAFSRVGLITAAEHEPWCQHMRDADGTGPPTAVKPPIIVPMPRIAERSTVQIQSADPPEREFWRDRTRFSGEELETVLVISEVSGPWRLQSVELYRDGIVVDLACFRSGQTQVIKPRVRLDDDLGTVYDCHGSGGGGSAEAHRWKSTFTPTVPSAATALIVAIEEHQFTIRLENDIPDQLRSPPTVAPPGTSD